MKIGIYQRVSTDTQNKSGVSLKDQGIRGQEFCNEKGWDYEFFSDGGYSGTLPIEERPALNELMNKIFLKEITGVFVIEWDRFTRDIHVGLVLKETFKTNNIRVFESSGEINLFDESQSLLLGIKNLLSSYEIQRSKVRIKRSLERNAKEGKVGGGKLINYGYTKDENKKLIVENTESLVIKLIFKKCIDGEGTKKIAEFLNEKNIPTKRMILGGEPMSVKNKKKTKFIWRDSVIYSILTNPIYMGKRRFKGNLYDCPSIISEVEFNLTQRLLKERKNFKNTTNKYFYLLKGLIYCSECQNRFYGRKREDLSDNQYICSSQRYKNEFCGTRGINIDKLNTHVWNSILTLPEDIRESIEDELTPLKDKQDKKLLKYQKTQSSLLRKKDRLVNLYSELDKGFEHIKPQIDNVIKKLELVNEKIRLTKKEMVLTKNKEELITYVKEHLSPEKYDDEIYQQKVIRSLVDSISLKFNKKENIHFIWIQFKLDSSTKIQMGKEISVKYKKSGWRMDVQKTNVRFRFSNISPRISEYPIVNTDKKDFVINIDDNNHRNKNPFKS